MANPRARALRKNLTDAERQLWSKLRFKQLDGHRFHRQVPIGQYIVDLICLEQRLIIEVDGGQHADEDTHRARWLERQGFQILRFWNNEVLGNTDGVLSVIRAQLAGIIPPP